MSLPIAATMMASTFPTIFFTAFGKRVDAVLDKNQFFGASGVDSQRVTQIATRDALAHRHRETLQYFVATRADQVNANDALVVAHANKFVETAAMPVGQRLQHRSKLGAIDRYRIPMPFPSGFF